MTEKANFSPCAECGKAITDDDFGFGMATLPPEFAWCRADCWIAWRDRNYPGSCCGNADCLCATPGAVCEGYADFGPDEDGNERCARCGWSEVPHLGKVYADA